MAKHEKKRGGFGRTLKELTRYPVLLLFFVLLFGMFAVDIAVPDKERSAVENTVLAQRPVLSLEGKKDISGVMTAVNTYVKAYEKYVKEQVAGRDGWIALQAGVETTVLQKTQSGGMLLGKDGKMFARTYSLLADEQKRLPLNTQAVSKLAARWPGLVSVMLVPSASTVYPEAVPAGAPLIDENALLDEAFAAFAAAGAHVLDAREALAAHKDEYLYYRTDHHWTTTGAYRAYEAYCESQGLTPFDRAAHTAVQVPEFYGTSWAKARNWNAVPDVIEYYELPNTMQIYSIAPGAGSEVTMAGLAENGPATGLYNDAQWAEYDKYAAFLQGNHGFVRVQGDGTGSVLVVKDSYANSFIPYLTANYETIDVVDFRYFSSGLDGLIAENGYDQVLVLYSFASFKADLFLSRAGIGG